MPRVSAAEKQKSHERILDAAARLIRERGIEATSVADVMKAAGLTHGGFYKHFPSKRALVAEAFCMPPKACYREPRRTPLAAAQCVMRRGRATRGALPFRRTCERHRPRLPHCIARRRSCARRWRGAQRGHTGAGTHGRHPRPDAHGGDDSGLALTALLVGTVMLARLAEKPELSARILEAGRRAADLLEECSEEGAAKGGKVT